jgi:ABC-type uncharacterized transport system auxiliary subunit
MNDACPSRARRALLPIGGLLLGLAIGGCSITRPAPVKNTFLLAPPAPSAVAQPKQASLRVGTINVAAPFRSKAFVYRASDLQYVNDFYTEFLVPPAAMIAEASTRALDRARVFARVAPPGAGGDADYVLDGFVEALYGDTRNASKPTAEIAIAFYLTRADAVSPFWAKEYRKSVVLSANAPEQFATALSAALGEILAELVRDLAAVELPQR